MLWGHAACGTGCRAGDFFDDLPPRVIAAQRVGAAGPGGALEGAEGAVDALGEPGDGFGRDGARGEKEQGVGVLAIEGVEVGRVVVAVEAEQGGEAGVSELVDDARGPAECGGGVPDRGDGYISNSIYCVRIFWIFFQCLFIILKTFIILLLFY